jgi:hypothetical protein
VRVLVDVLQLVACAGGLDVAQLRMLKAQVATPKAQLLPFTDRHKEFPVCLVLPNHHIATIPLSLHPNPSPRFLPFSLNVFIHTTQTHKHCRRRPPLASLSVFSTASLPFLLIFVSHSHIRVRWRLCRATSEPPGVDAQIDAGSALTSLYT